MKQLILSISVRDIPLDREAFNRIMGFGQVLPPHFDDMFQKVSAALEPGMAGAQALIFDEDELKTGEDTLRIRDVVFQIGPKIGSYLHDCESIALFICTMGLEFERNMKSFSDSAEAYFADTIGSLKCEALADLVQESISLSVQEKGFLTTNRYSPGYCQWNLSEQQKLFSFFPDSPTGISLNESSLMIPIKSISALLGLGKNLRQLPYSCRDCVDIQCSYRKY